MTNDPGKNDSKKIIKTALELALEKVQGDPLPPDILDNEQYRNDGRRLAAAFVRGDKPDLTKTLTSAKDIARPYIEEGIKGIFFLNLVLPRNEEDKLESRKALEGISIVSGSNRKVLALCGEIEQLLTDYFHSSKTYFEQLKQEFSTQEHRIQKQGTTKTGARASVDPEHLPEFRKKWQAVYGELQERYTAALNELKDRLRAVRY